MLKQRIITAIVLLAILLPALFWPSPVPFMAVALVLIGAGAWEWARLNGLAQPPSVVLAGVCLALCAASWYAGLLGRPLSVLWAIGGGLWVLAGAWLLRGGVAGWPKIAKPVRLAG